MRFPPFTSSTIEHLDSDRCEVQSAQSDSFELSPFTAEPPRTMEPSAAVPSTASAKTDDEKTKKLMKAKLAVTETKSEVRRIRQMIEEIKDQVTILESITRQWTEGVTGFLDEHGDITEYFDFDFDFDLD